MEKIRELFNRCEMAEGEFNGVHILNVGDDEYRIYTDQGHCLSVRKQEECDPDEVEDYCEVLDDGCSYTFMDESFQGFKTCSIDEALEIMKNLLVR